MLTKATNSALTELKSTMNFNFFIWLVHNVHIVDCNHSGMSKVCTLASSFQA